VTSEVVLAWSGGKDSSLTLETLRGDERFTPVALLTTITREYDRISMHGVRRSLLHAQAASLGLPLVEAVIPSRSTNETYEAAMRLALDEIRERFPAVGHVAFGDLYLTDVRAYRERQLAGTGFTPLFPVWGQDTRALADRFIADGYEAIAVCVDCDQISAPSPDVASTGTLFATCPPRPTPAVRTASSTLSWPTGRSSPGA